jgi:hypothetical protein
MGDGNGRGSGIRELKRCRKETSKFQHHNYRIDEPHAEGVETIGNHYLMGSTGKNKTSKNVWDMPRQVGSQQQWQRPTFSQPLLGVV